MARLLGHVWTVAPTLRARIRAPRAPLAVPFNTRVHDAFYGDVRVTGEHHPLPGATALLVVIHGLAGSIHSPYMARPAHVAHAAGMSCLRLNLRGADLSGDDVYHAALTADLAAALAAPELSEYRDIFVLGFSMGGHMLLRWALEPTDARVRAATTVCSPLDLRAACNTLDAPSSWVYREHLLRGLKAIHENVDMRGRATLPRGAARYIRSLRSWDEQIIAPRFGFDSAHHYYAEASAAPHLGRLALPCLLLVSTDDPMITAETLRPALRRVRPPSEVQWLEGGHVGFPPPCRLEESALAWMLRFASA